MVTIKSKQEIEKMREACRVAALAQKAVEEDFLLCMFLHSLH